MREEIHSAANFLTNMMRLKDNVNQIDVNKLEKFRSTLLEMLITKYDDHWFPFNPNKGSGYRCIRINHKMDPILSKAGVECGFPEEVLKERFPNELTMWVDPREVSYRIGENGSICVLYEGSEKTDNRQDRTPTATMDCIRNSIGRMSISKSISNSSDDIGSCSPMSISPPTPGFEHLSTCKSEFSFNSDFIMEARNGSFVEYVSS
ncbi:protein BTG2 [Parasteatoda tepidariorum]|uniref:protein BTG2 n=1 Tax=Parasteatoda tepidariorum TaxID=114398 RepID=UPI001C7181D3|nr:protein BTG2-like [Parasteatoda tepidariorum]